ncbi:hypothetical protein N0V85_008564 [Neurospora sp. IMI 360204]|nr:hypothetical protein N0V85_008564 [Neurospora sp. IMI 360204]
MCPTESFLFPVLLQDSKHARCYQANTSVVLRKKLGLYANVVAESIKRVSLGMTTFLGEIALCYQKMNKNGCLSIYKGPS